MGKRNHSKSTAGGEETKKNKKEKSTDQGDAQANDRTSEEPQPKGRRNRQRRHGRTLKKSGIPHVTGSNVEPAVVHAQSDPISQSPGSQSNEQNRHTGVPTQITIVAAPDLITEKEPQDAGQDRIADRTRSKKDHSLPRPPPSKVNKKTKAKKTKENESESIEPETAAAIVRVGEGGQLYRNSIYAAARFVMGKAAKGTRDQVLSDTMAHILRGQAAAGVTENLLYDNLERLTKSGMTDFCDRRNHTIKSSLSVDELRTAVGRYLAGTDVASTPPSPSVKSTNNLHSNWPAMGVFIGLPLCLEILVETTNFDASMTYDQKKAAIMVATEDLFQVNCRSGLDCPMDVRDIRDLINPQSRVEATVVHIAQRVLVYGNDQFTILPPGEFDNAISAITDENRKTVQANIRARFTQVNGVTPKLLAICNVRQGHFVLMSVDMEKHTICHYDSISQPAMQFEEMRQMEEILVGDSGQKFKQTLGQCSQQFDGVSCALYSFVNFLCLLRGLPVPKHRWTAHQLDQTRSFLFKCLYGDGVISATVAALGQRVDLIDDDLAEQLSREVHVMTNVSLQTDDNRDQFDNREDGVEQ